MPRHILLLFLAVALPLLAADESEPPISITSPDTATTYAFGKIKSRSLHWSEAKQTLSAEVTFVDEQPDSLQSNEDSHSFLLPGITLDKAHGIFYATSVKGEVIPVARRKKSLFLTTIQVLPNAIVRVNHSHGNVTVTLEAIRPADVAKEQRKQDAEGGPDATHSIDLHQLLP
jgi:hypothetical protein